MTNAPTITTTTPAVTTAYVPPTDQDYPSDWWEQIGDADRAYLLGPRKWPRPCPWCGGRLVHNPLCLTFSWEPVLSFGKHNGKRVSEVPIDYLAWLLGAKTNLDGELEAAIRQRLAKEGGQ
jgi:hypothetical protein